MKIIKVDTFEGGIVVLLTNEVVCSIYDNGELGFEDVHTGDVPDDERLEESTKFVIEHFGSEED